MQQPFSNRNFVDSDGRPAGGFAKATGIEIRWQDGPLGRDGDRIEPNGAFVETLIAIVVDRLEFYNSGQFRCRENSLAITHLEEALHWLQARTQRREREGVEGTHEGS